MDPANPENLVSLGRFHGAAYSESDSAITNARILGLDAPKIALIWQFLGTKEFTFSPTGATVKDANIPFRFEIDLRTPPDNEILDAKDLALGTFWLYQDANGNGKLDRLIHPELLSINLTVDQMNTAYLQAMDRVLEVAKVEPVRVDVEETYYIGRFGTTVHMVDGKPDTIWTGAPETLKQEPWISVLNCRFRVLNYPNRWELFFALRKKSNDYFRIAKPAPGFAIAYDFPYQRKLFPLPGREAEFELRVREATGKLIEVILRYESMRGEAVSKGWNDYPFEGFDKPGEDWVAGRTRSHFLLYIRNQVGMDEMRAAELSSSFNVANKERLHLGYNLIQCSAQYECRVLDPGDSIHIDYGMSEAYFNPPSAPVQEPLQNPKASDSVQDRSAHLLGAYRFQPFHPFCLVPGRGGLWASVPNLGTFRLVSADSSDFFAPAIDLQFQVVEAGGKTEKLLMYSGGKRYVATADSSLEIPESVNARVRAISALASIPVPAGKIAAFAGDFEYGRDTLRVVPSPDGDSLRIGVPGMTPHYYLAASESVFFSRDCDCRATFRRTDADRVSYLVLSKDDTLKWCPAVAYGPRTPASLFPGLEEPDSLVSASQGSMHDTYRGLDGQGHYPGSADGLFLKAGDGWVEALDHSFPGDSISLSQGGEGILFRLDGLQGHSTSLELALRRESGAGKARARFRLSGGADSAKPDRMLADDFWVDFQSDSATLVLKPLPVTADPFFIRLERVPTADPEFLISFDAYRVQAGRGAHAHP